MHGRKLKASWESVPGAAPRERTWPPAPGRRKDVRVREPSQEEQEKHASQYDKVKRKALKRAPVALRELRLLLARLKDEDALEVLTAGDENAPELPSEFSRLLHEASARFGMTPVPPEKGGSGELFIQHWLLAHELGMGEAWTKGGRPRITLEVPPFSSASWKRQASLTKLLRDEAAGLEGVTIQPEKEGPKGEGETRGPPLRMTIHEKPERREGKPGKRRRPPLDE